MFKSLTVGLLTLLASTVAATGNPYCDALVSGKGLNTKHARIAPIYSDRSNGWIFTSDQMKTRYHMKTTAEKLVTAIVDEFEKRGITLAIVVPPPRPVIAGQGILDQAMGSKGSYNVADAQSSFEELILGLRRAGAIAPDLQKTALQAADARDTFYFKRDTHWTPTGAALSALALADLVSAERAALFPSIPSLSTSDLTVNGEIEERGSLSNIVRSACDLTLAPESTVTHDWSNFAEDDLFADLSAKPRIALVGSSFSNRYQRDHYRFGDALASAFDAEIDNYSVSGGNAGAAIEAYVLSGALDAGDHRMVIWEIPSTQSFNTTSHLRQLLGALRLARQAQPRLTVDLEATRQHNLILSPDVPISGLEFVSSRPRAERIKMKVHFDNGSTSVMSVRRSKALPTEMRSRSMFTSFDHFGNRSPVSVAITLPKNSSADFLLNVH